MIHHSAQYIAERHRIITAAIKINRLRYYKAWRPIVQPQIELIPEHVADLTQESLDALLLVDNVNWLCKIPAAQQYGYDRLSPYFPYGIFSLTTDQSVLSKLPPKEFFDGVGFMIPTFVYTGKDVSCGARSYKSTMKSGARARIDVVNLSPYLFMKSKWTTIGDAVVHEIAHCMDFRGKFPKKAVDELQAWFSDRFLANEKTMLDNIRTLWTEAMKNLQDMPLSEIVPVSFPYTRYLDLLGTVKFCPMIDPAFSTKKHYFQGHERSYFLEDPTRRHKEFVADCVDMVWDTKSADVMAKLDPEFYEKAKEVFLGYWRK